MYKYSIEHAIAQAGYLQWRQPYVAHVRAFTSSDERLEAARQARLLNNLSFRLHAHGDLAGARPYFERALAIFTARLNIHHPHMQMF